jgi:CheY-like chemotaxis protein
MPASENNAWRVLLVDDDLLVCDSIRRMLEFDGHSVIVTTSAEEALAVCDDHIFDVILLDYLMPVTRGDELALAIKERLPHQPIIMITADAEKVEAMQKPPPGVDLVVGKPFRLDGLREAIEKVLMRA